MKFIVLMSAFMAFGAQAGTLVSVFSNTQAPKGYSSLGIYRNKVNDSYYAVAFGGGSVRPLNNSGSIYFYEGSRSVATDGEIKADITAVERDKSAKVIFTDAKEKKVFEGLYTIDTSAEAKKQALAADFKAEAQFDKYRRMDNPATPAELRAIFRQLDQDFSTSPDDQDDFPFPTFDLQIEYYIGVSAPNAAFANATVTSKGTDVISKKYLQGNKWYKTAGEAESAVVELYESEDYDDEGKVFASFSNKVSYEKLDKRLVKAISKHLKVEILSAEGFNCEDSVYGWVNAVWILKDGSSVSYSPGTECD